MNYLKAAWFAFKLVDYGVSFFSYNREFNRATLKVGKFQFSWRMPLDLSKASGYIRHRVWDDTQKEFADWAAKTFPESTSDSCVEHLRREVEELKTAVNLEDKKNEAADCAMLVMDFAARNGFSLYEAFAAKFEVNKLRKWGKPDAQGVSEHIE